MTKMIINITVSNWKFENPFNNKDSKKKVIILLERIE